MFTISIILARGGSKGVPEKNIRKLADKPLLAYSIENAKEARTVDAVYVSTDDAQIVEIARQYGANVIERPPELATDTASSESALCHALDVLEQQANRPDLVVFLQCTSPFRHGKQIDEAIEKLINEQADSLLSVSPSNRFLWTENINGLAKSLNYDYHNRPRRQDMAPQYVENGSIYIFKPWVLKETGNRLGGKVVLYCMPDIAALEIDSPLDFAMAEFLMKNKV